MTISKFIEKSPNGEYEVIPKEFLVNLERAFAGPEEYRRYANDLRAFLKGNPNIISDRLRQYAEAKALAMEWRIAGEIAYASRLEWILDRIHESLPAWAKW